MMGDEGIAASVGFDVFRTAPGFPTALRNQMLRRDQQEDQRSAKNILKMTGSTIMAEKPTSEFWKDMKPIENVFQPDAQPETYISNAPYADDKYFMKLSETGVYSRPLWISPRTNQWSDILMAKNAGLVNRHYHPHNVFAYTISGKWGYLEHDWTATAGDFIYESPGEGHTLVAYESDEPMRAFFIVTGPLIWLDEKGEPEGYMDVHNYLALARAHFAETDLGAEYVDTLIR